MKLRKSLVILGLIGVIAAAAMAGTAFAQTPTPSQETRTSYHEFFLDRLANALGTSREKLNEAATQARNDTIDQQVKDGRLTQEQSDKVKAKEGIFPFGFKFHGKRPAGKSGVAFVAGSQQLDAIAQALGMTKEDLVSQLRSGKTLAELAQGKEQAVKDAMVNSVKPKLDQAVKDGKLTQEQEDKILEKIQNSDLSKIGGHWGKGRFRGTGMGDESPKTRFNFGK